MSYQLNRLHLLICVFAGLVLTVGFVWHLFFGLPFHLFTMALWVSFAIVFFYFVGHIVRSILISQVFNTGVVDYDLSEDEEYQKFMASLEAEGAEAPEGLLLAEPLLDETLFEEYVEPLD
ncbi:MAG: hypothetical protein FWG87_09465 [Defluviitaleaceae bacterium]|nr:hypothetical protein [Defluviitaleaceae bacterium]